MFVEIKPDIFLGDDARGLHLIINICLYNNRYDLFVDVSQVYTSAMYDGLAKDDKALLNESFNSYMLTQTNKKSSVLSKERSCFVTYHSTKSNEFNISETLAYLNQKVSILLENSLNDSHFIKALIQHFEPEGKLAKALANDWVTFDNAGGCKNFRNYITGKLAAYDHLPKNNEVYFRCFVMVDSDREYPSLPLNINHIHLEDYLVANGIAYHILEKRNMENYLPEDALAEFDPTRSHPWTKAYAYLNATQKDFLNIAVGFTKKNHDGSPSIQRAELSPQIQSVYAGVSDTNFNFLDQTLKISSFKSNFPLKFVNSSNVYKDSLLARTAHQSNPKELEQILEKINTLL